MVPRESAGPKFYWAAAAAVLLVSSCCSAFHRLPGGTSVRRAGVDSYGSSRRGARRVRSRGSDEEDPPYMGLG